MEMCLDAVKEKLVGFNDYYLEIEMVFSEILSAAST